MVWIGNPPILSRTLKASCQLQSTAVPPQADSTMCNHSIYLHEYSLCKKRVLNHFVKIDESLVFQTESFTLSELEVGCQTTHQSTERVSASSRKLTRPDVAQQECPCRKRPGSVRGKTSPIFPSFSSKLSRTALTYSLGPGFG